MKRCINIFLHPKLNRNCLCVEKWDWPNRECCCLWASELECWSEQEQKVQHLTWILTEFYGLNYSFPHKLFIEPLLWITGRKVSPQRASESFHRVPVGYVSNLSVILSWMEFVKHINVLVFVKDVMSPAVFSRSVIILFYFLTFLAWK